MTNYGDMPYSMLFNKFEQTCLEEPENEVEYEQRNILRDRGPDPVSLASDAPRRNNESRGQLMRRHTGTRSGIQPNHSEQFFGLTERDPRGVAVEPDMKQIVRQITGRIDYIKKNLYPDAPENNFDSVPSMGRNQHRVIKDKVETFKRLKNSGYMRIFSTAKDGRISGNGGVYPVKSLADKIAHSQFSNTKNGEWIDMRLADPELRNRVTTVMSNNIPIGQLSVNDTELKVAEYGRMYGVKVPDINNQITTEAFDTSAEFTKSDESRIKRGVLLLMEEALQQEQDQSFNSSMENKNKTKTNPDYIKSLVEKLLNISGNTQRHSESFDNQNKKGSHQTYSGFNMDTIVVNPKIIEFTEQAMRLNSLYAPNIKAHARMNEKIVETAWRNTFGWDSESKRGKKRNQNNDDALALNKSIIKDADPSDPNNFIGSIANRDLSMYQRKNKTPEIKSNHYSRDSHARWGGQERQTANYSNVVKSYLNKRNFTEPRTTGEKFGSMGLQSLISKSKVRNEKVNINNYNTDNEFGDNLFKDRKVAPLGRKFMRNKTDNTMTRNVFSANA